MVLENSIFDNEKSVLVSSPPPTLVAEGSMFKLFYVPFKPIFAGGNLLRSSSTRLSLTRCSHVSELATVRNLADYFSLR